MEHLVFRWITSIEYYYHVFAGALHCYLEIMEKNPGTGTLSYWSYIWWFFRPTKNHWNVGCIGHTTGTFLENAHLSYKLILING